MQGQIYIQDREIEISWRKAEEKKQQPTLGVVVGDFMVIEVSWSLNGTLASPKIVQKQDMTHM